MKIYIPHLKRQYLILSTRTHVPKDFWMLISDTRVLPLRSVDWYAINSIYAIDSIYESFVNVVVYMKV